MIKSTMQQSLHGQGLVNNLTWYKALTLRERLASLRTQHSSEQNTASYDPVLARRRLGRWRGQSPFEKDEYFAERLAMDGMTEDEFLTILGESSEALQAGTHEVPGWVQELIQAFEHPGLSELPGAFTRSNVTDDQVANHLQSMSFLPALAPFIIRGIERLKAGIMALAVTSSTLPFDPKTVHQVLFANLPARLLSLVSRTLTLELNVARLEERLTGETPQERFQDFVSQLCHEEVMLPILEEYSSLARLLIVTVENWANYSLEFLHHLCTDWNEIRQVLFSEAESDPGLLVEVNGGVGDLHKSGRSTLKLKFSTGAQLVYKPKPMMVDIHFQELLLWLNERGDHPAFRILNVIDKGNYGWSEFVAAQSCSSPEEVARFYERQGGYLALLYALEATDVHFENLIAAGEHPMLIDLESLFHPRTAEYMLMLSQAMATETLQASVLRIGLLPQRIWGDQKHAGVDLSGLGGKGGQLAPHPIPQLEAVGTDHMRFIRQRAEMSDRQNRPVLVDTPVDVLDYSNQILTGFARVYRLLMQHREALLAGPLLKFAHNDVRLIIRPTQAYAQLLQESYHPDLLRNALDRDRFFDRLWSGIEQRPHLKRVIAAELADLHIDDIPMFTTRPNTRDIYTSRGKRIADFLDEPSLEAVRKRLQLFDEHDLTRQSWFIQASLATIPIGNGHLGRSGAESARAQASKLVPVRTKATRERLLKAAYAVGDRLCELALVSEHGANWIGLTYINEREWRLLPAGADLYAGTPGIALFLAYLGALTGEVKYTGMAKMALQLIRKHAGELREFAMSAVGAFDGWGSLLYLYAHLGMLWNDPTILHEAEEIVRFLPDMVEKDDALDIIAGSAGCISCLLNLYHVVPSSDILATALQCGDRLRANAAQCSDDPQAALERNKEKMPLPATRPLAGFSHGAAGMILSLLRLAAESGEVRFREAALAAIEYERSAFSPEKQNWPDFRKLETELAAHQSLPNSEENCMVAWCHGAPGIGLARLASLPYLDDALIRDEIDVALQTTLVEGFGLNHSLCHGDLGNLETLLQAAQMLGDPLYREQVEKLAAMILNSIEAHGWRTGIPMGVESPGLMTGIAGIGYELLRLAEPEQVPSVLALEYPTAASRKIKL